MAPPDPSQTRGSEKFYPALTFAVGGSRGDSPEEEGRVSGSSPSSRVQGKSPRPRPGEFLVRRLSRRLSVSQGTSVRSIQQEGRPVSVLPGSCAAASRPPDLSPAQVPPHSRVVSAGPRAFHRPLGRSQSSVAAGGPGARGWSAGGSNGPRAGERCAEGPGSSFGTSAGLLLQQPRRAAVLNPAVGVRDSPPVSLLRGSGLFLHLCFQASVGDIVEELVDAVPEGVPQVDGPAGEVVSGPVDVIEVEDCSDEGGPEPKYAPKEEGDVGKREASPVVVS